MEYLKNIKNYAFKTFNSGYDYFTEIPPFKYFKGAEILTEENKGEEILTEDKFIDISELNMCKIYPHIVKVNGFAANSASPTDTWSIIFKDNIVSNNSFIKDAFLKIFIDNREIPELAGLNYEVRIYRDIISNILNKNICGNFVKYINFGFRCSYQDLFNFLKNNTEYNGVLLSDAEIDRNLIRNVYMISKGLSQRPSIQDTKSYTGLSHDDIRKIKRYNFNMILNENIKPPSLKLFEWVKEKNYLKNPSDYILQEFWNILFQICYGCYCMSLSKLVHNDLHSGNVFIQYLQQPVEIIYIINDQSVIIQTRYKAVIYDFDRGYTNKFGNNPILEGNNCILGSQCNTYIENKDIIKILCYVYNSVNNDTLKDMILNLFNCDDATAKELVNVYKINNRSCFLQDRFGGAKPVTFYEKINNTKTILNNIITKVNKKIYDGGKKYIVYSCNENYFNSDGTLNEREIDKYQKNSALIKNRLTEDEIKLNNLRNKKLVDDREKIILEEIKISEKSSLDRHHKIMLEAEVERQRLNAENKRQETERRKRREQREREERDREQREREQREREQREREEREREREEREREREESKRREREHIDLEKIEYCKDCKNLLDTLNIHDKKSFKLWALKNHPDKFNLYKEKLQAEELFKKVSPCYNDWKDDDSICKNLSTIHSFLDSQEVRRRQEEEVRRRQEEEVRRRQEEEARRRQEEARRRQEEEARRTREEEARRTREEEARRQEEYNRRKQEEYNRIQALKVILVQCSYQFSDTFLDVNFRNNVDDWVYINNPIPVDVIERSRNIVLTFVNENAVNIINNNALYLRYMAGENVEDLTLEIIFNNIANFVNINQQTIVDIIRQQLFGNFWVPSIRAPVNIYNEVIINQPMDIISDFEHNNFNSNVIDMFENVNINSDVDMYADV